MSSDAQAVPVLFVDDEENILKSINRLFMEESYEILTADSGPAGLDVLKKRQDVAVIVSDQRMPGMSGAEFLEQSRALAPDAVRLVLTGYADITAAVDAINKGGAWKYLAKPWEDEILLQVVREAAERFTLMKKNRELTEIVNRQNEELKTWNSELEVLVQKQTIDIQNKNKELEKLNDQLRKNFRKSIEAFSSLIEMREKTVSSHSKNVAAVARQLAVAMKLPEQEMSNILVAALLHDIGKIGIPDSVLAKRPDDMNGEELEEYRKHAVRGQVAVDAIEGFTDIGLLIRHHHERLDGSGWPDGLKKTAIPLGSRVLALADAFDRMTNMNPPSAEGLLKTQKNIEFLLDTHYDRSIYQHLSLIISKKREELEKPGVTDAQEMEVLPVHLRPDMVLTRDVRSGSGLLILARGSILDDKIIAALQRYHQMDPSRAGIFVKKTDKQPR